MRVLLHAGGKEIPAEVVDLGPLGAELSCSQPPAESRLELDLQSGASRLSLSAEVLRRAADRIWLAFHSVDLESLDTLEQFRAALRSGAEIVSKAEPGQATATAPGLRIDFSWTPPAGSRVAAAELAGGEPARTPPLPVHAWAALPTVTPAPPPAPAALAAPEEPPPEPPAEERREQERQEKSIPVRFDNLTTLIKEFTHNISFGGLFLYTEREFRIGEQIDVTLIHPTSGERLTLAARVAHAASAAAPDPVSGKPRFGVGVQFLLAPQELKTALADFIDSRQRKPPELKQLLEEAHRLLQAAAAGPRALLGVGPMAEAEEIRNAYFRLVDRFHPDRYRGKLGALELRLLDELFRRLTTAYETLQER
jgi:Tfp pilus assembly protein PilZ